MVDAPRSISRGGMASSISSRSRARGCSSPMRRGTSYIQGAGSRGLQTQIGRRATSRLIPTCVAPTNYHTVAEIDPAPGTVSMNRDLSLHRGRSLTVSVLGPDGKPLSGNQVAGLNDMGYSGDSSARGFDLHDPQPSTRQGTHAHVPESCSGVDGRARPGRKRVQAANDHPSTLGSPDGPDRGRARRAPDRGVPALSFQSPRRLSQDRQGRAFPGRGPCTRQVLHPSAPGSGLHAGPFRRERPEGRSGRGQGSGRYPASTVEQPPRGLARGDERE